MIYKYFLYIFVFYNSVGATYTEDSAVVRMILDKNGCTSRSVEEVTDSSRGRITGLFLSHLKISSLPEDIGILTGLKTLWVDDNNLFTLPAGLENCEHLEELNCAQNHLSGFLPGKKTLGSLTKVNLDKNDIISLPRSLLKTSPLQTLSIRNNKLHTLSGLVDCTSLQYVYLDHNEVHSLPEEIDRLESLEVLTISNNKLSSLPAALGSLKKLRKLEISSNSILSLPESITQCSELTDLYMSSNRIVTLPLAMASLNNLCWLYADNNRLKNIPQSIDDIQSLQWLSLAGNALTSLPESIGDLRQLKVLILSFNAISTLPQSIINLQKLTTLRLDNNTLTTLPPGIDTLTSLVFIRDGKEHGNLTLSNNRLCSMDEKQKKWADQFSVGWENKQKCAQKH